MAFKIEAAARSPIVIGSVVALISQSSGAAADPASLSATFFPTDVCEQGPLMDSPDGSGRTVIGPSPPSTNAIASRSPDRLRIRRCGAGDVTATEPANAW